MSVRAVLLGLGGAVFMCALTYFNDHVIRQTWFVFSSMPTAVYGGLLVILLVVSPALGYVRKRWRLTGSELAVALALTLVPCVVPSAGLLELTPNVLMMPHHMAKTDPGWEAERVIEMAPPCMLPDVAGDENRAVTGYVQGLSTGTEHVALSDVPWSAWVRTLAFWLPLALLLWIAVIGASLVVHRQWSDHEKVPYPIATFTETLLPQGDEARASVFRERLFWLGCGVVCFIHLTNYLAAWLPEHVVPVPRTFYFYSLRDLVPVWTSVGGWWLLKPMLVFTVIGLAYFLPKDISFSLGIGPYFYYYVAAVLAGFGIAMGEGGWYAVNLQHALQAGAYAGLLALVVYTGRRYYGSVFRAAVGLKPRDPVEPHAVWGARALMAATLLFIGMLVAAGLDWMLAVMYALLILGAFVVIARVSAETGFIFIQPWWEPAMLIVGFMGIKAVGPTMALVMFLVSSVLIFDTRESLAAFVINALRIVDRKRAPLGRTSALCVVALVVGLAVAVPVTLYIKYDRGTNMSYNWGTMVAPRFAFDEAVRIKHRLTSQGELEAAEAASGLGRLVRIAPSGRLVTGFVVALALFLGLSAARFRLPWWPLHPIILIVWTTYPASRFAASFLIACFVKWAVVKYGGDSTYQRLKPLMVGLVAGDMLFGLTSSAIGFGYYFATGVSPPHFSVFW